MNSYVATNKNIILPLTPEIIPDYRWKTDIGGVDFKIISLRTDAKRNWYDS